jgi:hypothetical protein
MLTPLLIIGLGGSGGKTIRSMKQALNRKLESVRYEGGLPAAWQFLQIDTTVDGVSFPAPMLPADEVHVVVPSGEGFARVLASITSKGTNSDQHEMLTGWGIATSSVTISAGAGQTRAIGRQVAVANSAKTLQAIQGAIAKMKSPTALAELASVAKALGANTPDAKPQAFIISSIAGGSGAGMFMDVAELLKRATPDDWAQEAISFLYTAEVFNSLGALGANVSKNSLGAMNELIGSKWIALSERSELLYSKLGLVGGNNSGKNEYGCKGNILIGARNSAGTDIRNGVDGAGMDEVFLTIGEMLAGAFSNDEISEWLVKVAFVNIIQNESALDISGLSPEDAENPTLAAAGIGFGRMTLGADRIVDYVADALTKRQVEKLLWPELTPALLKGGISVRELIQEKADEIWPNFLLDSGLDERGSQNQIVDALLPEQAQERVKQYVNGIIKKNVSATAKPLATFSRAIWSEWETESSEFLTSVKNEMSSKAQKWVPGIQDRLKDLFANELMLNGYAVITNLTERLEVELRDHAMPELLRDHNEFSNAISGFDQQAFNKRVNEIADGLTGVSTQNGPFFEKLSQSLTRVLEFQINSHVNALAASLVQDMLSFFITPLKEQLADSRFTLHKAQKADLLPNGSKNPYMNYPDWSSGVVPNRYKARTIERILIDSAEYESTYDFYASKDSQGAPAFQQSVSSALLGKKMNPMPGDLNPQTLITVSSPWITSVRDAQGTMGAAVSKSEWNLHTDIAELSERNRRWLKHEDSTFGKFTNMSIRTFVGAAGEGPQIRDQRESKFVKEYQAMLALAQPLVLLNPNAMSHILAAADGEKVDGNMIRTNKIPFAPSSNVGQACTGVLQQSGFNPANPSFEQDWFDAGSNDSSMFAASTTQASLPAWAFASLTEPILQQVAQSKNAPNTWIQFWKGRRTRPLVESIPFETEMRRSMITGWFVATLFGMRKVEIVPAGRTVQIWNPTLQNPGWSTFPSPLLNTHLEDNKRSSWVLPQLLVSAGIALADFGKSGNSEFINGYKLLKYLGREVTTSMKNRDKWDGNGKGDMLPTGMPGQSTFLKDWVTDGSLPGPNLNLLKLLQANISSHPDRGSALIETIEQLRSEYNGIWQEYSTAAWHKLPETWELKEDIDQALDDLLNYVQDLHITSSVTSDE